MARTSRSKNEDWYKWEEEVARLFDTKPTPGSGNQDWQKGDVVTEDYILDCKNTDKDSYSIKNSLFEKYEKIAALEGKNFAVALNLNGRKLIITPLEDFVDIADFAKKYQNGDFWH